MSRFLRTFMNLLGIPSGRDGGGIGRTITVSPTAMISSTGRPAREACSRMASGLDAW